eukprot:1395101-Amorphochlora_amoeboformis.AAC.1
MEMPRRLEDAKHYLEGLRIRRMRKIICVLESPNQPFQYPRWKVPRTRDGATEDASLTGWLYIRPMTYK